MKHDVEHVFLKAKRMRDLLVGLALTLIFFQLKAQTNIPVGTWQTHNAFNKTIAVTSTGEQVIAAANSAIFTYSPSSKSTEIITTISGLSDTNITAIGYNETKDLILTAYENGNIDLISSNKISNFRDLLLSDIPGSKRINHVYNFNQFAYLSADFGVMIIDLDKNEVSDSYFELGKDGENIKIYSATTLNDSLYLATDEGIIGGNLADNLKDFNLWKRYADSDGLPASISKIILQNENGLLAAFDNFGLYKYNGGVWTNTNQLINKDFINGSSGEFGNLLVTDSIVYQYNGNSIDSINYSLITDPKAAIFFGNQPIIADYINGLVLPESQESIYPNGPFSNNIVRLFGYEDKMIAIPQAYDVNFNPLRSTSGYHLFNEGEWVNYNSTKFPNTIEIPEFLDITDAMFSYSSEKLYLSSFGYGILEVTDDGYNIYDDSNSSLTNTTPSDKSVYVTALDANSNFLSAVNFNATAAYHQYDFGNGQWNSNQVGFPASRSVQIRGFENNTFWIQSSKQSGSGIIVFNSDDNRELIIDGTYLPSSYVNDIAIDREGKMWVATEEGVVFFYNAKDILDQTLIDPVEPIYDGQILFRNEELTALAVDGGNRIWMATTFGVWLFASDGLELIHQFNTDNSPLPSNTIFDISINHQSGEVFFATDAGLISYRSDATIASVEEPLKIYPNPVLRSTHDIVTIQGVSNDADFKITDSSGRLVYKGTANGNTATWSGISSNVNLSSGVYFVFVTTKDGDEKQVGKIALVN